MFFQTAGSAATMRDVGELPDARKLRNAVCVVVANCDTVPVVLVVFEAQELERRVTDVAHRVGVADDGIPS